MRELKKWIPGALLLALALALPLRAQQPRHPHQQNPEDLRIQQVVNEELAKHETLKNVHATVDDRIVNLEGSVDCYREKLRAEKAARHKPGVEGVRDYVVVGGVPVSDDVLGERIAKKLRYDRVERGNTFNSFTLQVKRGVVILGGYARLDVDHNSALDIVQQTCGVKDVVDQVTVLPVSPGDDRIRFRMARAIYGDPVLQKYALDPQQPIRIVVANGHVTLYGVVNTALDRQVAYFRAREVPGVFSVTNELQVASEEKEKEKK